MKLEKAIEIQSIYVDDPLIIDKCDFINALKLGIEAMKFTKGLRDSLYITPKHLLPGETDD